MASARFAYHTIKSRIISQELPPGLQLKEEQLSNDLGTTRTPIREAIIRLEREGLVKCYANKGAFVIQFSEKEIEDLLELREALEIKAAHLAIRRANRDELAKIRIALEEKGRYFSRGITAEDRVPPTDFHTEIVELSKNQKLISFWGTLNVQLHLIRIRSSMTDHRYLKALEEHKQILAHISKGHYRKTQQLISAHIAEVRNILLSK